MVTRSPYSLGPIILAAMYPGLLMYRNIMASHIDRSGRTPELDGIRGLACLFVMVGHFFVDQFLPTPGTALSYVHRCLSLTTTGVDLFFVLSGFLLGGILFDNRGAPNLLNVFYVRRAARIFPVYFAWFVLWLVAVSFLANDARFLWVFRNPLPDWAYATYLQNFGMALRNDSGPAWLGITWSLAVEEQFYLILPALVLIVPRHALPWLVGALVMSAPILRAAIYHFYPDHPFAAYVLLPCRWDGLFLGVLGAWASRQAWWRRAVVTSLMRGLFICVLIGAIAAVRWWPSIDYPPFNVLWYSLVALAYAVVVVQATELPLLSAFLRMRALVALGGISYGAYLFHMAIAGLLHGYFRGDRPLLVDARSLTLSGTALVVTIALAWASYRFFEAPILRLGHRWKFARPQDASQGTVTRTLSTVFTPAPPLR